MKKPSPYLLGKPLFYTSLVIIVLVTTVVYLSGLPVQRSIEANLYLSLSILSFVFFALLFVGLYKGYQIVDNYNHLWKIR